MRMTSFMDGAVVPGAASSAAVVANVIAVAIRSPEIDGEKTMTLSVCDRKRGKTFVIRYNGTIVVQHNGVCRVYDPDEIEDVLGVELGDVVAVRKSRYVSKDGRRPDGRRAADVRDITAHLEKFDADSEEFRIAQVSFGTRRGVTADLIVVTHDGKKTVVERRSEVVITRDDRPTVSSTEFYDIGTAMRCLEDHLAFCDDRAIMELGHETKTIELFSAA